MNCQLRKDKIQSREYHAKKHGCLSRFQREKKGSLQKGYLADMIVIDRNFLT